MQQIKMLLIILFVPITIEGAEAHNRTLQQSWSRSQLLAQEMKEAKKLNKQDAVNAAAESLAGEFCRMIRYASQISPKKIDPQFIFLKKPYGEACVDGLKKLFPDEWSESSSTKITTAAPEEKKTFFTVSLMQEVSL